MKTSVRQNRSAVRFFAAWSALVLYVGAASPLGAGLATLVGSFDRDHHALVQTELGSTRLILHHEQKSAAHHHGVVARSLTLFAEPVHAGQPDHVLQFSVPDCFSHQRQLIASSPPQLDPSVVAVNATLAWLAREDSLSSVPTHLPSDASGRLPCVRSTVLLI